MPERTLVVAIGGNSLITDPAHESIPDQIAAVRETTRHIAALVRDGWRVAVSHGNGPQVGFILRRSELAAPAVHELPLDVCDADSQGEIGYEIQQSLSNDFARMGLDREVVTVVTRVEVAADDPAFARPSKPIGAFMHEAQAFERRDHDGWHVVEDAGRGWRRVVPSPRPQRIVEEAAVRTLVEAGFVVVAVGGGGIPVVQCPDGELEGVAAVIDKDFASSLLARRLGAERFVISTAVDRVALDWGTPRQRWIDRLTADDARRYLAEGTHFAPGSMAPKIEACLQFLDAGGAEAIITSPENLERAIAGDAGTHLVP